MDLHSRCAERQQGCSWTRSFCNSFQRALHREKSAWLLNSGVLPLEDGATQLLKLIRLRLGKDLQQDVSEHYKRFLHRSTRLYQQSMRHYIPEESNLHERALEGVKSLTTSNKTETDSKEKEIIADVLRGFLLLENAALTGSEQVFVFGVAGKSDAYNHIANALRETWGNDERLRSQDSALSQQLQSGHLAGGVHWSAEDNEWTEADYDCEESLDPWSSKWCDTEGYDDEYLPEETDWTDNYYETRQQRQQRQHFLRTQSRTSGPTCQNTGRRHEQT